MKIAEFGIAKRTKRQELCCLLYSKKSSAKNFLQMKNFFLFSAKFGGWSVVNNDVIVLILFAFYYILLWFLKTSFSVVSSFSFLYFFSLQNIKNKKCNKTYFLFSIPIFRLIELLLGEFLSLSL